MLCLEIISYSYVLVGIKLPVGGLLGIYQTLHMMVFKCYSLLAECDFMSCEYLPQSGPTRAGLKIRIIFEGVHTDLDKTNWDHAA